MPNVDITRRSSLLVNIGHAALLLWFLFQVVFYAVTVQPGVAPDEYYHLRLCESIFNTPGPAVKDTALTAGLGPVSTRPYLYHLVLGKALHLKPQGISSLGFLRCLNVILAVCTFCAGILLARLLAPNDHFTQLAALLVLSNVTMFVFLCGMLSYDNLVNLLSVVSFSFAFRYIRSRNPIHLLIILSVTLLGLLTKETYALVALVQFVLLIFAFKVPDGDEAEKPTPRKAIIVPLCLVILVLLVLNVRLYGGNLLRYHSLAPGCEQVLSPEECGKIPRYQRDQELLATVGERSKMHPLRYVKLWLLHVEATSLGILGHKPMVRNNLELLPFNILLLLSVSLLLFRMQQAGVPVTIIRSILVSIAFITAVCIGNYLVYGKYRFFELAVQGRYLFPVLVPLSVAVCYPLFSRKRALLNRLILAAMTVLFVLNGFVWFLINADSSWFR